MSIACSLVPLVIASTVLSKIALTDAREAVQGLVEKELIVMRDSRKKQIEEFFKTKRAQLLAFSQNPTTVSALQQLPAGDQHDTAMNPMNPEVSGASSVADGAARQQFHEHILRYRALSGIGDVYLVNRAGEIVYSAGQAQGLADSPKADHARAAIDAAVARAGQGGAAGSAAIQFQGPTDAGEAAALYMAAPVYDVTVRLGVLVFEIAMSEVDAIMTDARQWHAASLGETGETYLVGDDFTARSTSRFLHQKPDDYFAALKADGVKAQISGSISSRNSNIGLQAIQTPGVSAALEGRNGVASYSSYMGRGVMAAFAPLAVDGLAWAVVAEMGEEEALLPVEKLRADVLKGAVAIVLFFAASSVAAGAYLSSKISRPIRTLCKSIKETQNSKDLTRQIHLGTSDETAEMAEAFNEMLKSFRTIILQVIAATEQLSVSAESLSAVTTQTREGAKRQQSETGQLASAINQMAHSFRDVARSAVSASESADLAKKEADDACAVMVDANDSLGKLSANLGKSRQVTLSLKENSDKIETILDVIKSVAEQTNLLALNAAIEAARAGEQGRGFAVVADEVRTLAVRTQRSADEIQAMISHLQTIANEAAVLIDESNHHSGATLEKAQGANSSLEKILSAIADINHRNGQIASATEEQSTVAEEINRNVSNITSVAEDTADAAVRTSSSSDELAVMSAQLNALVNAFKVAEHKHPRQVDAELF